MHLIFTEKQDKSTNNLIDWLIYKNEKYIRFNGKIVDYNDSFKSLLFDLNEDNFRINFNGLQLSNDIIDSIYYRRLNNQGGDFISDIKKVDNILSNYLTEKLRSTGMVLKDYLINKLQNTPRILGDFYKISLNKLIVLDNAKEIGLTIPETIITNSFDEVVSFFNKHKKIISKSIEEVVFYHHQHDFYSSKTTLIDSVNVLNEYNFSISLFQEYIKKDYDLRVFFLDGFFYAAAIFSQKDKKTEVDFRNYSKSKPNKIIPFHLPKHIKRKVTLLMKRTGLNIGSIDFVVRNKRFYFLEINPVGQYDFISHHCNYNIDYHIAKYLCNEK